MFELWVSAHRLTEVNISLKLNENRLKSSGDRRNTDVCADRQTDVRTDRRRALLIPLSLRGGRLKIKPVSVCKLLLCIHFSLSLSLHLIRFSWQLDPDLFCLWSGPA